MTLRESNPNLTPGHIGLPSSSSVSGEGGASGEGFKVQGLAGKQPAASPHLLHHRGFRERQGCRRHWAKGQAYG